ncbi:MAG: hypothetical protein IPK03_15790 [Bacteroidetes bacterium]|nr:hypothetical protein [Bacteroidota bacterium]
MQEIIQPLKFLVQLKLGMSKPRQGLTQFALDVIQPKNWLYQPRKGVLVDRIGIQSKQGYARSTADWPHKGSMK